MEAYPPNQSSWGRAIQDTVSAQKTARFMWGGEVVLAGGGGTWLAQIAPIDASTIEIVMRSVIGGLSGLIAAILIILVWNLFRAPYKQRNEARLALQGLPQTPLSIECDSYTKTFVGKDWLDQNQYLWSFNATLTNQSDTLNVGTTVVHLQISYPLEGSEVRVYAVPLLLDADKDKYGHVSREGGKPLRENEYLHPREPVHGYYQFLDVETPQKPYNMRAWPTLVIVDSFGAIYRREFKRHLSATQPISDKKDSKLNKFKGGGQRGI